MEERQTNLFEAKNAKKVHKSASEEYILKEEVEFLGKEIGNFFAEPPKQLAGYESIQVTLTSPNGDNAYKDWINSSFYSCFETWNKSPEYPVDELANTLSFEEKETKVLYMLSQRPISATLESVHFTFRLLGVPRSLLAQFNRHRQFALCERSMRVSSCYADAVRVPESLLQMPESEERQKLMKIYEDTVKHCRETFKTLVEANLPIEQVRNIMPIGVLSSTNATMDLKSLVDYFRARTIDITMDEHTYLVCLMAKEMKEKQPKFFEYVLKNCKNLQQTMEKYLR